MSVSGEAIRSHRGVIDAYRAHDLLTKLAPMLVAKLGKCQDGPEKELAAELVDIVLMLGGAARESAGDASAMASGGIHISRLFR